MHGPESVTEINSDIVSGQIFDEGRKQKGIAEFLTSLSPYLNKPKKLFLVLCACKALVLRSGQNVNG